MPISVIHLRAFHGVAREGGYTKAARTLNVSQPTLSLQIKALEEGYGVNLFERQGRGVRLTAFGKKPRPRSQGLIRAYSSRYCETAGLSRLFTLKSTRYLASRNHPSGILRSTVACIR